MSTYTDAEIRNFFEWQREQYNPIYGKKTKDAFPDQTVDDLMADPVAVQGAIETMTKADQRIELRKANGLSYDTIAPWEDPNWREKQEAAEKAEAERQAEIAAQQSPNVVIGGT